MYATVMHAKTCPKYNCILLFMCIDRISETGHVYSTAMVMLYGVPPAFTLTEILTPLLQLYTLVTPPQTTVLNECSLQQRRHGIFL